LKSSVFTAQKFAFFAVSILFSNIAVSQSSEWSIVQFSGQMHATAAMCGDYSQSQLQEMKKKQKEQYVGLGMSSTKFESDFQQGYVKEKARLDQSSLKEKAKECQKLKSMTKM
jgi:hypothetical protein